MVSTEEVIAKVKEACPDLDAIQLTATSSFKKLGLDSMDTASLMLDLEESYHIKIPGSDIPSLDNVELIVAYLNQKAAG